MDERLILAISLVFFLFIGLHERRTAFALSMEDENVQSDQNKVQNRAKPRIVKAEESFVVAEGETVKMRCNIENVEGWAVIWYKGDSKGKMLCVDGEIPPGTHNFDHEHYQCDKETSDKETSGLIIRNVTTNQTDFYTCVIDGDIKTIHSVQLKDGQGAADGNHASFGLLVVTILTTLLLCR